MLSTSRTLPTPGTEPSSRVSPASAATPVTVPMVSKKSVSMIAKITRIATSNGSVLKTLPMSNAPMVEKFGVSVSVDGTLVTPAMRAMIVVTRMEMTRAALMPRAHRTTVTRSPKRKTNWPGVVGNDTVTSVPAHTGRGTNGEQPDWIRPPLAKPMKRMNRPMPAPIARLRASGTAFMTASRKPTRTSSVTARPSRTMTPIAPAGGKGKRIVRDDAHGDRHDPGDQGRSGRQGDPAWITGWQPEAVAKNAGVQEHDVDHDHERGQAGSSLRKQVRAAFGELEIVGDRPAAGDA